MDASISFNFSDMEEDLKINNKQTTNNVCFSFMNLLSVDTKHISDIIDKIDFSDYKNIKKAYNKIKKIEPLLLLDNIDLLKHFDEFQDSSIKINELSETILTLENVVNTNSFKSSYSQHLEEINTVLKNMKEQKEIYQQINKNIKEYIYGFFNIVINNIKLYQLIIDVCYIDKNTNYFDGYLDLTPLKKFVFYTWFVENNLNFFDNLPTSNIKFTIDCSTEEFFRKKEKYNDKTLFKELFKENISPMYQYTCKTLEQFLQVSLFTCLTFNLNVKKCENCHKYFIAYQRSDEMYCNRISPQDSKKTCKQYSNFENWKNNINTNEELKIYRRIYMSKQMKTRRNPDNIKLKEDFDYWKKIAQVKRNEYSHGIISKKEFLKWLEDTSY